MEMKPEYNFRVTETASITIYGHQLPGKFEEAHNSLFDVINQNKAIQYRGVSMLILISHLK